LKNRLGPSSNNAGQWSVWLSVDIAGLAQSIHMASASDGGASDKVSQSSRVRVTALYQRGAAAKCFQPMNLLIDKQITCGNYSDKRTPEAIE
jgi:hypothetical protein